MRSEKDPNIRSAQQSELIRRLKNIIPAASLGALHIFSSYSPTKAENLEIIASSSPSISSQINLKDSSPLATIALPSETQSSQPLFLFVKNPDPKAISLLLESEKIPYKDITIRKDGIVEIRSSQENGLVQQSGEKMIGFLYLSQESKNPKIFFPPRKINLAGLDFSLEVADSDRGVSYVNKERNIRFLLNPEEIDPDDFEHVSRLKDFFTDEVLDKYFIYPNLPTPLVVTTESQLSEELNLRIDLFENDKEFAVRVNNSYIFFNRVNLSESQAKVINTIREIFGQENTSIIASNEQFRQEIQIQKDEKKISFVLDERGTVKKIIGPEEEVIKFIPKARNIPLLNGEIDETKKLVIKERKKDPKGNPIFVPKEGLIILSEEVSTKEGISYLKTSEGDFVRKDRGTVVNEKVPLEIDIQSQKDYELVEKAYFDKTEVKRYLGDFISAMKSVGINLVQDEIVRGLKYTKDQESNQPRLIFSITDKENNLYTIGFFGQINENNETEWRPLRLKDAAKNKILIGAEIDPGHPNDTESGYLNFALDNFNHLTISGAMMNQFIHDYGSYYFPYIVEEYMKKNSFDAYLSVSICHLLYHHDSFPQELTDKNISPKEKKELARNFIRRRIKDVIGVVSPLMKKYPNLQIQLNLANEAIWEYNGGVGWEGEYSNFPLFNILGKNWIPEAYVTFEEVIKEHNLPRNRFVLLMNDWGIEIPGLKSNYYKSQRNWVIKEIAKRLGISPEEVQLDVGIQFGYNTLGLSNQFTSPYVTKARNAILKEIGEKEFIGHLGSISEDLYITEFSADTPIETIRGLKILMELDNLRMINFWDVLNRGNRKIDTLVDKNTYKPLVSYYFLMGKILSKK